MSKRSFEIFIVLGFILLITWLFEFYFTWSSNQIFFEEKTEFAEFKDQEYVESWKEDPFLKKIDGEYSCKNINETYVTGHLEILPQYCREFSDWENKILEFLVLRKSYTGIDFLVLEKFSLERNWYIRETKYVEKCPEFIQNAKDFWLDNYAVSTLDKRDRETNDYIYERINLRLEEDYKNNANWVRQLFIEEK